MGLILGWGSLQLSQSLVNVYIFFGNAASWEPEREKPDNRNFGNAANWEPDWGNFEPGLHRTQSDSFLPYGRPPNINQD